MDITTTAVNGTRQHHVELIAAAWRRGVESIIQTGQRLIEAKEDPDLPHGEFTAMIESELPFGPRTAERLMAIARNPVLSNPTHVSVLPPSWGTLYELTKLDDELLLQKIEAGEITPEVGRATVAVWCGKKKRPRNAAQPADPQQDGDAEGTPEECWRRSFAGLADDVLRARGYWTRQFGEWERFTASAELVTAVQAAAAEWPNLVKYVLGTTPEPAVDAASVKAAKRHKAKARGTKKRARKHAAPRPSSNAGAAT
jgi:Protein of unknown function (DUF3102)